MTRKDVIIYTDGACQRNPGPGGYGVVLLCEGKRRELSQGYQLTTNNRMEIMAAIAGLESLKYPCNVTIYTDSQYLADTVMKGWAKRWQAKGWMKSSKHPALNVDLWKRVLALCELHTASFIWVKGHAGLEENERCDRLSVAAAKNKARCVDEGYINKETIVIPEAALPEPLPTLFN